MRTKGAIIYGYPINARLQSHTFVDEFLVSAIEKRIKSPIVHTTYSGVHPITPAAVGVKLDKLDPFQVTTELSSLQLEPTSVQIRLFNAELSKLPVDIIKALLKEYPLGPHVFILWSTA
jgi:hypothetical protein